MRLHMGIGAFVLAISAAGVTAAPPDTNACALLTRDEAAAAAGSAVAEGKPHAGGGLSGQGVDVTNCTYSGGGKELVVNLWSFSPKAQASLDVYRGLCKKKEQAAGLGDLACWYNADHKELQVLKGSSLLILELRGRRDASDALVTAAKQALARLR